MPKVSVVIPTYNCAKYLPEAIGCVLLQTLKDVEVVVIDDGSCDDTKRKLAPFLESIRYIFQKNAGVSVARNNGIRQVNGEYVAFLDADDLWDSKYLEKMVKKIEEGFDWVTCDNKRLFLTGTDKILEQRIVKRDLGADWDQKELLRAFLTEDRIGSPNKILIRRKILAERAIFFDERLRSREDWDFCLQLIKAGFRLGYVPEPLVTYRVWDGANNSTRKLGNKWIGYTDILLDKYRSSYFSESIRNVLARHYYDLARHSYYHKDYINTMKYLIKSAVLI